MILNYLKYGFVGLCAILSYLSYDLLLKEQKSATPRKEILNIIKLFMLFSLLIITLTILGGKNDSKKLSDEIVHTQSISDDKAKMYAARWDIVDGEDIDIEGFKKRYYYKGSLTSNVVGNNIVLSGEISSYELSSKVLIGSAKFKAYGPLSDNFAATYYTYANEYVNGFGTCLLEFDNAGNAEMYLIFRITRTIPKEGNIGQAKLKIKRSSN